MQSMTIGASSLGSKSRWSGKPRPTDLLLEAGFPPDAARRLAALGYDAVTLPAGARPFGAAVAAGFDRATGTVFACHDSRRETWAGVC
jgi:hypothetical protein